MKVDSAQEMLALTKVKDSTKTKVVATKKTITPGGTRMVKKAAISMASSGGARRA